LVRGWVVVVVEEEGGCVCEAFKVAVEDVRERKLGARDVRAEGGNDSWVRRCRRSDSIDVRFIAMVSVESEWDWEKCARGERYAKTI
jgi:hypothetical protein